MPVINLTRYIVSSAGIWTDPTQDQNLFDFSRADTVSPERLLLRWAGDFVALTGPLRVRVTVQAENMTVPLAYVGRLVPDATGSALAAGSGTAENTFSFDFDRAVNPAVGIGIQGRGLGLQASTIYSYTLDIAAGQAWPFSLSEQLEALRLRNLRGAAFEQLGNNLGFRVIIEPAFAVPECTPAVPASDLPCDFAVADRPDAARFFPAACEPCEGSVIGLPPQGSVSLVTPPADGGCVRTRFFNGMFITREDLETEQRYHRLKSRLHNRAAGSGVVWGLGVGKQGSQVCVLPGYGVDCCGNDLALTITYHVEIAALVADPAAAALVRQKGPQRLNLLLEYVECPSDPRPVHGDPCAPEASRCEMSRIRESVRLRLAPPCDDAIAKNSSPIQRFLDEVRELRKRYPLGEGPATLGGEQAPFTLDVAVDTIDGGSQRLAGLRPSSQLDTRPLEQLILVSAARVSISVKPDSLWTFVRGTLAGEAFARDDGSLMNGIVQAPASRDLSLADGFNSAGLQITFELPPAEVGRLDRLVFRIAGWQAHNLFAAETDPAASGDLTLTFGMSDNQIREVGFVETPIVVEPLDLAANPCVGEPCAPRRRFEPADVFASREFHATPQPAADPLSVLPWLHTDPAQPSAAGDPKALILATLGVWLMQMLVREGEGTTNKITSPRREIAQGIYRVAWLLLFGVPGKADPAALGGTLRRLLEAWCDGLLWKGPECCGDIHGVVIGCALVEGGTIQRIDPFGGRRHVVHYPLLAHWGMQFGIAPPDLTASRFFSKLCCIAGLAAPDVRKPDVPAGLVALGRGWVAVGDPGDVAKAMDEQKIEIVAKRRVGMPEMIASALTLAGTTQAEDVNQYTALVLGDFVADGTVMLLLPNTDNTERRQ